MAEPPPTDFVPRPEETRKLVGYLLDRKRRSVAITTALRGAGGYGKTTLAQAICHEEPIRRAFRDGILWVTLGKTPNVLGQLRKLYTALVDEQPVFEDVEDGARKLAEVLDGRRCLLVIDDVWNKAHLDPFLRSGDECARLITTRNRDVLPPRLDIRTIDVDEMREREAVALLGGGLLSDNPDTLQPLADRLGHWPLLLRLVNGVLCRRVNEYGQSLSDALDYVWKALDKGPTTFDARAAEERNQAVTLTLEVSLDLLGRDERKRYAELAIFPEDTDIPFATLGRLWGAGGDLDTEDLCVRLYQLSLLQHCDLTNRCIRLHDVIRDYLMHQHDWKLQEVHGQLLDAYTLDHWSDLPADEPYLWHHLTYHLREAERCDELQALLLDPDWMQAKLRATDVNALLADYGVGLESGGNEAEDLKLVQGAIRLSAHVLARDRAQLCSQLYGRLLPLKPPGICDLVQRLREWQDKAWLRLLSPTLVSPVGALVRTLSGHTAGVWAVALTADGKRAVSGSSDHTLKVWDLESGQPISTFSAEGALYGCAVTKDGTIVTGGASGQVHFLRLENDDL